ncbi:hypothetical protein HU200_014391 [Digitaria exilis]|uniref:F-box domain-containing protein n=1 Tax=Digitaria exilis TaxID=1010633 RepID=A0A835FCI4_9POAL|nr:hypothetical protein HU200_014391 [Digitaria exilis]
MGNLDTLPDPILELVLLGLDSPLCLLRAVSTCKRWWRIITSDAFLTIHGRRRSIVAGFYYNQRGVSVRPRFEPSPSTATINADRFSLDFLPIDYSTISWRITDSCGSLLLLFRKGCLTERWDQIVCEPLTRSFEVIPHLNPFFSYGNTIAALLDGKGESNKGGGGVIGMPIFRIMLCLDNQFGHIRAYMFTSGRSSWHETGIDMPPKLRGIGFAAERRYWHGGEKTVVTLDQSALKFSSFVLPNHEGWDDDLIGKVTISVGRDGEACIVVDGNGNMLMIFRRQKAAAAKTPSSGHWRRTYNNRQQCSACLSFRAII